MLLVQSTLGRWDRVGWWEPVKHEHGSAFTPNSPGDLCFICLTMLSHWGWGDKDDQHPGVSMQCQGASALEGRGLCHMQQLEHSH